MDIGHGRRGPTTGTDALKFKINRSNIQISHHGDERRRQSSSLLVLFSLVLPFNST
jgi:hypothetical protein